MLPFCGLNNEVFFKDQLEDATSEDVHIIPEGRFKGFIDDCNSLRFELEENNEEIDETIFHNIESKYCDVTDFNDIKTDSNSTFGICHVNLASINLHFDDLKVILDLLKVKFNIAAISEHKLLEDIGATTNINLDEYYPFEYDPIKTTHCGTGYYIKK